MNNLPKVVTQQRRGRASNPRLLDRKSDALPLSHRATLKIKYFSPEGDTKANDFLCSSILAVLLTHNIYINVFINKQLQW